VVVVLGAVERPERLDVAVHAEAGRRLDFPLRGLGEVRRNCGAGLQIFLQILSAGAVRIATFPISATLARAIILSLPHGRDLHVHPDVFQGARVCLASELHLAGDDAQGPQILVLRQLDARLALLHASDPYALWHPRPWAGDELRIAAERRQRRRRRWMAVDPPIRP
jgi:hypothetical protein